ncbi:MAG: sulfatase-like hydrolase/transferase [Bacilli bacterium]|nr:sulfatase-like hydrolase/transferase [Bacilli bacterium]
MNRAKVKLKRAYTKTKKSIKKGIENHIVSNYIKNNILFFTYLLVNVLNATLLRFFCMHSLENYLSIRAIIADAMIVTLVGSFGYLLKPKNRSTYFIGFTIFFSALCMINSIYYTFYTSFASLSMIGLIQYIGDVGDAVVENVVQLKDMVFVLAPIIMIFVARKLNKKNYFKKVEVKSTRKKKMLTTISIAGVLAIFFFVSMKPLDVSRLVKQWNKEYIVMRFGIYIYQGNDIISSLQPKINSMFGREKAQQEFTQYFEEKKPEKKNDYTNLFKGKNVIMIHGESMMTSAMSLKFNGKEVTPNLNKMADGGMFFPNFHSQVSVGTSSDTELTLNTSLMPTKSGTAFVSYYNRTYIAVPSLLKEKGYYTFSMHANNGSFWNRQVMHESLGYDKLYDKAYYNVTKENSIGLGLSDKEFFAQSIPMLQKINEKHDKWYGVMIMLSNHTPFSDVEHYGEFPVDIKEKVKVKDKTVIKSHPYMEGTKLGNYFKSLHYADSALGEFLKELDDAKLLDNTVVILYGDHDSRLSRKDWDLLYNYNKETDSIYDEKDPRYNEFDQYKYELGRRVPFIIWTKDMKDTDLNKEYKYTMGMYDVSPTIGNMFGFENKYALGHDIFNIKNKNIVCFPNGNWVNNKVYYNSQKNESYPLTNNKAISQEEIIENTEYTNKLLDVSNNIIVYDLLKDIK